MVKLQSSYNLALTKHIILQLFETNSQTYIIHIYTDFLKAFDCVNYEFLYEYIRLISRDLYFHGLILTLRPFNNR